MHIFWNKRQPQHGRCRGNHNQQTINSLCSYFAFRRQFFVNTFDLVKEIVLILESLFQLDYGSFDYFSVKHFLLCFSISFFIYFFQVQITFCFYNQMCGKFYISAKFIHSIQLLEMKKKNVRKKMRKKFTEWNWWKKKSKKNPQNSH